MLCKNDGGCSDLRNEIKGRRAIDARQGSPDIFCTGSLDLLENEKS